MSILQTIIIREYLVRIRKKSFWLIAILGPALFVTLIAGYNWFKQQEQQENLHISYLNQSDLQIDSISNFSQIQYHKFGKAKARAYDAHLVIHPDFAQTGNVSLSATHYLDPQTRKDIQLRLRQLLHDELLKQLISNAAKDSIEGLQFINQLETIKQKEIALNLVHLGTPKKNQNIDFKMGISYLLGFLIYMFVFSYGVMVMRGISEEKMSRILEVIIASVSPFKLMFGKILGIGLSGLTQFIFWILISHFALSFIGSNQINLQQAINQTNAPILIIAFTLFFIGGYLLYASLFAAIGALSDLETDLQQFVMPILLPLIFAIAVLTHIIRFPSGRMAIWLSHVPLTSPVAMLARIGLGPGEIVSYTSILCSLLILYATAFLVMWLSGRVYKVGILMYGQKTNYKKLFRLFMNKY